MNINIYARYLKFLYRKGETDTKIINLVCIS